MPDALALTLRQYRLERRMFWRNPAGAFFNFGLPLIFLLLLGAVFAGRSDVLDVLVPGIAGLAIMSTTFTALAMNLTTLREAGVLKRIRGTPLPAGSYLASFALHSLTNAVTQVVLIIGIGHLVFGTPWPQDWPELVVFAGCGILALAAFGVAFSHVIPNVDSAPVFTNAVFLPMIFLSGTFYETDSAPSFVQDIARALPLTHVIQGIHSSLEGGRDLGASLNGLAVIAVWGVVAAVLAVRGFSWDSKRA